MQDLTIGFIGGGNMARSLIGGLIADGVAAENIMVADPDEGHCRALTAEFGVATRHDNATVASAADVVVLAVKPQVLHEVTTALADRAGPGDRLFLSVAAGVRAADIERWLGAGTPLVRAMPNTPALVQSGATGLYGNAHTTEQQREAAEAILRAVGLALWVDEEAKLDAITAISGSGPAYFFAFMEALEGAGERLGLEREQARLLAIQTAFGASKMALESPDDPGTLRERVTSPGGTTERALEVLEAGGMRDLVNDATAAARERAGELADLLGES
jgi:pyrroline-5-carboxylate reductase